MAIYTQERTIKEYWEEVKDQYPQLTFKEFEVMCKAPAIHIIQSMRSKDLPDIMVKNLGKFIAFPPRIKAEIKISILSLKKKVFSQEVYDEKTQYLEEHLVKLANKVRRTRNNKPKNNEEPNDDIEEGETTD